MAKKTTVLDQHVHVVAPQWDGFARQAHETDGGKVLGISDLLPDGARGQLGQWRITVEFDPTQLVEAISSEDANSRGIIIGEICGATRPFGNITSFIYVVDVVLERLSLGQLPGNDCIEIASAILTLIGDGKALAYIDENNTELARLHMSTFTLVIAYCVMFGCWQELSTILGEDGNREHVQAQLFERVNQRIKKHELARKTPTSGRTVPFKPIWENWQSIGRVME